MADHPNIHTLESKYEQVKALYVDPRLDYYKARVKNRWAMARLAAFAVLLISIFLIPFVTNFMADDQSATSWQISKAAIISGLSLAIALVAGLQGLFNWEGSWKEYSQRIIEIETYIGLWKIHMIRASHLSDVKQYDEQASQATEWLIGAVNQSVQAEMGKFFSALPGRVSTGESDKNGR